MVHTHMNYICIYFYIALINCHMHLKTVLGILSRFKFLVLCQLYNEHEIIPTVSAALGRYWSLHGPVLFYILCIDLD